MNNKLNKIFVRFYRQSSKSHLELTSILNEIIVGLMLGDLYAEKLKLNSNTRLQFKQSIINKDYISHLYSIFKDYCNSEPKVTTSLERRPGRKEIYMSIKFWTSSLPCFNKFREMFYDEKGKKFIPLNLEEIISARSLAYWLMDDGYKSSNGFYFCTESYTLEDNEKLSLILKTKFNLKSSIHKHSNGHRLYIPSTSKPELINLVRPFVIPHFNYKLD